MGAGQGHRMKTAKAEHKILVQEGNLGLVADPQVVWLETVNSVSPSLTYQ